MCFHKVERSFSGEVSPLGAGNEWIAVKEPVAVMYGNVLGG